MTHASQSWTRRSENRSTFIFRLPWVTFAKLNSSRWRGEASTRLKWAGLCCERRSLVIRVAFPGALRLFSPSLCLWNPYDSSWIKWQLPNLCAKCCYRRICKIWWIRLLRGRKPRCLRPLSACEAKELGVRFEGKIQVRNLVPLENALFFCVYKYCLPELLPADRSEVTTNDSIQSSPQIS